MGAYYLDSSAMVKRFSRETGTSWLIRLFRRSSLNSIYISRVTPVETVAGLAKQQRMGLLATAELDRSVKRLVRGTNFRFIFVEVNRTVADTAMALVRQHDLRGFDAVQLAAALEASRQRTSFGMPGLIFVSADKKLNLAASAEGLTVDDPNNH